MFDDELSVVVAKLASAVAEFGNTLALVGVDDGMTSLIVAEVVTDDVEVDVLPGSAGEAEGALEHSVALEVVRSAGLVEVLENIACLVTSLLLDEDDVDRSTSA